MIIDDSIIKIITIFINVLNIIIISNMMMMMIFGGFSHSYIICIIIIIIFIVAIRAGGSCEGGNPAGVYEFAAKVTSNSSPPQHYIILQL